MTMPAYDGALEGTLIQPSIPIEPVTLTTDDAARYLGVAATTIRRWRQLGTGPQYLRLPGKMGKVLYRVRDLNSWLDTLPVEGGGE